jgi:hypothetical protein
MILIRPVDVTPDDLPADVPIVWDTQDVEWGSSVVSWFVIDTDKVLQSSSVAATDDDEDEWDVATTYAEGDIVTVLGEVQRRYESLGSGNIGNDPVDSPLEWVDLGFTRRWRMFDGGVDTITSDDDFIQVTLYFAEVVNGLALFNVGAGIVRITVRQNFDQPPVYDQTIDLRAELSQSNWFAYFFGQDSFVFDETRDIVDLFIPGVVGNIITLTLLRPSGVAEIGLAVFGRQQRIGTTVYGTRLGIEDFSRKERDDFGNFQVVERRFINRMEYLMYVPTRQVPTLRRALAARRAKGTVFIGADEATCIACPSGSIHEETIIYGFPRDFDIVLNDRNNSECSLEVEGL